MKPETKERIFNALTTASAYLLSMRDTGIHEDDYVNFGCETEEDFELFLKACDKASGMIDKLAERYRNESK